MWFCCGTERQNHARELIREISLLEWDGIVIVSGDGLLHEVNVITIFDCFCHIHFINSLQSPFRNYFLQEICLVVLKVKHVN